MSSRKLGFAVLGLAAASLVIVQAAYGAASTDTGDKFSLKAGTVITVSVKKGTKLQFSGTTNGVPVTITCTSFAASGKIPAAGLTIPLGPPPPIFGGCTDSFGGVDTIKTSGKWLLSEIDAKTETAKEPNTGDKMALTIPKAGATNQSSKAPGCTATLAPAGSAVVLFASDDASTMVVSKAAIPVAGAGCTTGSNVLASGTLVLSKSVHDT